MSLASSLPGRIRTSHESVASLFLHSSPTARMPPCRASSRRRPTSTPSRCAGSGELGFLPGEPVQVLRRGPGGREPLAVMIGETMFALAPARGAVHRSRIS